MVALGLAALVVGDESIYESQLRSRAEAPAHRAAFGLPLLSSVPAGDVMTPPRLALPGQLPLEEANDLLRDRRLPGAPVVEDDGRFVGVLRLLEETELSGSVRARAAADRTYPSVRSDQGLDDALDALVSAGIRWVPVVDGESLVGIIAMTEVIAGYQRAMRRSLRLLGDVRAGSALLEVAVSPGSAFAGETVATAPWPRGTFALSIDRQSLLISPTPDTPLQVGDVIVAVVPCGAETELRRRLGSPEGPA